jgi:6,7-dimethyl-8-ribityllumazine synthase
MKKVLIINAEYYTQINKLLLKNTIKDLNKSKIKYSTIKVPGVFEIPVIIAKYAKKFDAFIALGCVIKGETPHFDLICNSTFHALMTLSIKEKKPIGNGIITALNISQANKRSKLKGLEATKAVTSVLINVPTK